MKVRTLGLLTAVAAVAVVPVTADAESSRDRATGGGQVLLDPNNPPTTGALDTVAFTAQRERGATDDSGLADGQVQVNRRSGDDNQVKFHGVVDCLIILNGSKSSGEAYISGHVRGEDTPFELYVTDGGAGAAERGGDQTLVWYGAETEENEPDQEFPPFTGGTEEEYCGIEEDPSSKREIPVVARGNNQVYDASEANAAKASTRSTSAKTVSLSALR